MYMLHEAQRPTFIEILSTMSVHSATPHDICPIGLTCCEVTIWKSHFKHTFIVCTKLQKKPLIIGLDMQVISFRL